MRRHSKILGFLSTHPFRGCYANYKKHHCIVHLRHPTTAKTGKKRLTDKNKQKNLAVSNKNCTVCQRLQDDSSLSGRAHVSRSAYNVWAFFIAQSASV